MADNRFECSDMAAANKECGTKPGHQHAAQCQNCKMRVMLHCHSCRVQVTGCVCTEVDRFGEDEAWKRSVQRWGDKVARERMKEAGFWTPNMHN